MCVCVCIYIYIYLFAIKKKVPLSGLTMFVMKTMFHTHTEIGDCNFTYRKDTRMKNQILMEQLQ